MNKHRLIFYISHLLPKYIRESYIQSMNEYVEMEENICRIKLILSNQEDMKEIKIKIKKTYKKIKEYLMQSCISNSTYTINHIYDEYYNLISFGLGSKEINKTFYDDMTKKYNNIILIENERQQLLNCNK